MLMHEDYAADCEHCLRCPCNYLYDCYYHGFGMNIDHVRYWHLMKCWTDLLLQSFLGLTDVDPDFVMPRRLRPLNLNSQLLEDQRWMRFVGHKLKKKWTFKAIVVCYHQFIQSVIKCAIRVDTWFFVSSIAFLSDIFRLNFIVIICTC